MEPKWDKGLGVVFVLLQVGLDISFLFCVFFFCWCHALAISTCFCFVFNEHVGFFFFLQEGRGESGTFHLS